MAIRFDMEDDGILVVTLDTVEDWNQFAADNEEEIVMEHGSLDAALELTRNGGLELGGGAAVLVTVYFSECL